MPLNFFSDDDQMGTPDNIIYGKSDYHAQWLRGLHKDSIQRKKINSYQAQYYRDHKDSINKGRRAKRLKDKDSTI